MADVDFTSALRSTGFRAVTDSLGETLAKVREARREMLTAAGLELVGAWKQELSTPGTGHVYVVGHTTGRLRKDGTRGTGTSRTHQASAPGQPPAPDTGALRNSIQMEYQESRGVVRVGTNLVYAAPLEFGTRTAGRTHTTVIAPRPAARPALAKAKARMGAAFFGAVQLVTRRGTVTS